MLLNYVVGMCACYDDVQTSQSQD